MRSWQARKWPPPSAPSNVLVNPFTTLIRPWQWRANSRLIGIPAKWFQFPVFADFLSVGHGLNARNQKARKFRPERGRVGTKQDGDRSDEESARLGQQRKSEKRTTRGMLFLCTSTLAGDDGVFVSVLPASPIRVVPQTWHAVIFKNLVIG
jgi:hypothetical protein